MGFFETLANIGKVTLNVAQIGLRAALLGVAIGSQFVAPNPAMALIPFSAASSVLAIKDFAEDPTNLNLTRTLEKGVSTVSNEILSPDKHLALAKVVNTGIEGLVSQDDFASHPFPNLVRYIEKNHTEQVRRSSEMKDMPKPSDLMKISNAQTKYAVASAGPLGKEIISTAGNYIDGSMAMKVIRR